MSDTFRGKTEEEYEVEMEQLRTEHSQWKKEQHDEKAGFLPIFSQNFRPYLQKVQGPAIRLYMYLALNSRNDTGEIRLTQKQIESFFQCSSRSVINWLSELEKFGLIKRIQTGYKTEGHIFLRPYHPMKLIQHSRQNQPDKK